MEERKQRSMARLEAWLAGVARGLCLSLAVASGLGTLALLCLAAMLYNARSDYRETSHRVEARIVAVRQEPAPQGCGVLWVPELVFRDTEGGDHTVSLPGRLDAGAYVVGGTVPLLYKDYDQEIVREDTEEVRILAPKAMVVLAVVTLFSGAGFTVLYILQRRRGRRIED